MKERNPMNEDTKAIVAALLFAPIFWLFLVVVMSF
jgi:hypothetical protein